MPEAPEPIYAGSEPMPDAAAPAESSRWLIFRGDGQQGDLFAYDLANDGEPIAIGVDRGEDERIVISNDEHNDRFGWSNDGRAFGYIVRRPVQNNDHPLEYKDDLVVMTVGDELGVPERIDLAGVTGFPHASVMHVKWAPSGLQLVVAVQEHEDNTSPIGALWILGRDGDGWRARQVPLDPDVGILKTFWLARDQLVITTAEGDFSVVDRPYRYFVVDTTSELIAPRELMGSRAFAVPLGSATGRYISVVREGLLEVFDTSSPDSAIEPAWTRDVVSGAAWAPHEDRLLYWQPSNGVKAPNGADDIALLHELNLEGDAPESHAIDSLRFAVDEEGQPVDDIGFASWSPSGELVVVSTIGGLLVLDFARGENIRVAAVDDLRQEWPELIGWTPHERILYRQGTQGRVADPSNGRSVELFGLDIFSSTEEELVRSADGSKLAVRSDLSHQQVTLCTDLDSDEPVTTTVLDYDRDGGLGYPGPTAALGHLGPTAAFARDGSAFATTVSTTVFPGETELDIVSFASDGGARVKRIAMAVQSTPLLFQP